LSGVWSAELVKMSGQPITVAISAASCRCSISSMKTLKMMLNAFSFAVRGSAVLADPGHSRPL